MKLQALLRLRQNRKYRVRKKISGTPLRPRLSIYKSNKIVYAQLIDDTTQTTLVTANTRALGGKNIEKARLMAHTLSQKALEKGINHIVLDRRFYAYHGVIKAISEAAKNQGLQH